MFIYQIFLTGLAVATAITSFAFAFMFEKFMDQMSDNYRRGELGVDL